MAASDYMHVQVSQMCFASVLSNRCLHVVGQFMLFESPYVVRSQIYTYKLYKKCVFINHTQSIVIKVV